MSGEKPRDLLWLERALTASGYLRIAGTDEAGRGCLAGPVFAAAVILPCGLVIPGVDDSKKLSPARREELYSRITGLAVAWSIASVGPEEIDRINIHRASLEAMRLAVEGLVPSPEFLLVDGRFSVRVRFPQRPVVGGDGLCQAVASASVLAKVSRDRWMRDAASRFPEFEFERHKGYGTVRHRELIRRYGPSPLHRKTFRFS